MDYQNARPTVHSRDLLAKKVLERGSIEAGRGQLQREREDRSQVGAPITYVAGGLEDGTIRKPVCNILEGGEEAFRERSRRLRVGLDR